MEQINNIIQQLEDTLSLKIKELQDYLYEKGGPSEKFYELRKLARLYVVVLEYTGKVTKPNERH